MISNKIKISIVRYNKINIYPILTVKANFILNHENNYKLELIKMIF